MLGLQASDSTSAQYTQSQPASASSKQNSKSERHGCRMQPQSMLGNKQAPQPSKAPAKAVSPDGVHVSHDLSKSSNAATFSQQQRTIGSRNGKYIPPNKRSTQQSPSNQQLPRSQQSPTCQPTRSVQQSPSAQESSQTLEFAVQLFFDMSNVTATKQGRQLHYSGHLPPLHHSYSAVHDYIAHICPQFADDFGVDIWLDTFHATLGELEISKDLVPEFQKLWNSACASLPPVTSLEYTTTRLGYTRKEERLNADEKGVHFYHIGLETAASQLKHSLQPWMSALQNVAAQTGATFAAKPFQSHHITIRCHTKWLVPLDIYHGVGKAIHRNPVLLKVAGIRIQQAASQALEHYGNDHIRIFTQPDKSKVTYPVPLYTSAEPTSAVIEKGSNANHTTYSKAAAEAELHEAAVPGVGAAAAVAAVADDTALLSLQLEQKLVVSTEQSSLRSTQCGQIHNLAQGVALD